MVASDGKVFPATAITFGSLFAGIGGLDLGFERAGMVCKWQVEINPYGRSVLEKHWPEVRRHDDVRTWPAPDTERVDVIAGGFPCQDISNSGHRVGIGGGGLDCGKSLQESFAVLDRDTSSWRTSQLSLFGGWTLYCGTWPYSGSMRSGACFQRAQWVLHTHERGCSLWPTPRAADGLAHRIRSVAGVRRTMARTGRSRPSRLEDALAMAGGSGGLANPEWLGWLMGFPPKWTHLIEPSETASRPS